MGRTLSTVVPTPNGPSDVLRSSLPLRVQRDEFVKSMKKSQTSWTGREIRVVTSIRTIVVSRFQPPIQSTFAGGDCGPGADGAPAGRATLLRRIDRRVSGTSRS